MSKYIVVDVEADGPIPGPYSMVSFGAVVVDNQLDKTFYGEVKPISDKWIPEALAISGITRAQHLKFGRLYTTKKGSKKLATSRCYAFGLPAPT